MSVPVVPIDFYVYRIIRENEIMGTTLYSKDQLLHFSNSCLEKASKIQNVDYWAITQNKYATEIEESLMQICDATPNFYEINENKIKNGGMQWAKKVMGRMPYLFLKCASQVLNEELKEKTGETSCDL